MKNSFRVHAALLFVTLIYAAAYSLSKDIMPRYAGPFGVVALRIAGAAIFFGVLSRLVTQDRIRGRADTIRSILCGVIGIGLNQLLFFAGLNLTSPINASLIQTVAPIVVVLASAVLLGEKITPTRVLGILLAAVGAALIILGRGHGAVAVPGQDGTLGNVFILLNATAFGIYLVIVTPLMRKYHPFTVLARIFLVGAVVAVPVGWQQVTAIDYAHLPLFIWAELVYMVVFLTILAYLLNNWALKYASPALLGVYVYLQPVLAAAIAISLGKDVFTWGKFLQALLIFAGVWLVSRRPKEVLPKGVEPVPLEPVQD
ncbi:DMT family transporter [Hymenobacter sp. DG25A]|uniref:DMT family transporter n=1 Tax=Hymenobacter sp. DG25A TaxID=1385663 RepID=UPI0006BD2FCD|nr:DMT family transporter [Hymenobacter sp. DG25A]ALD21432.1 transmembrane permease [Hymenobacter sp. DG25A]